MTEKEYKTDVLIIGGGLAGIVTALELADSGLDILLVDRDEESRFGGLAKESFGGIFFVNSPTQRRLGIRDSPDQALEDWHRFAEFSDTDEWPRKWAESYVNQCTDKVYKWLRDRGIGFFPVIHWVERGLFTPGNSVPRFHMVWGTGHGLVTGLTAHLKKKGLKGNIRIIFRYRITGLEYSGDKISGATGINETDQSQCRIQADTTVIAAGGIGGDIVAVKKYWQKNLGDPPAVILNGAHRYGLGDLHKAAQQNGAQISHLEKMWNYAAGIHHPYPDKLDHGLSVIPPKSALWVNYLGKRIGPVPLVAGFDTGYLVRKICEQHEKYSWQVMNMKIAVKEMAVSGSEFNDAIREKRWLGFLRSVVFGNKKLLSILEKDCVDFITAGSIEELAGKMNRLNGDNHIDPAILRKTIESYDANFIRGPRYFNDDQIRRIAHLRKYRGDRIRTCKYGRIDDRNAYPLVAVRQFILSRKSLGGIRTNLNCEVLRGDGSVIPGLLAVGESAGFGGGGMHGNRALEGTFLGGCIFTGRIAASTILNRKL